MADPDIASSLRDIARTLSHIANTEDVRRNNGIYSAVDELRNSNLNSATLSIESNSILKDALISDQDGQQLSTISLLKSALIEAFRECFTVEVVEGESTVRKGIGYLFSILNSTLNLVKESLFVEVVENNNTVQKSISQVLNDILAKQESIVKTLDGTNASGVARRVYNLLTPLISIKDNTSAIASNIQTGDANIVTAIGNISVTASVSTQDIADGIDASSDIESIKDDIYSIEAYLSDPYGHISSDLSDIKTAVESIDTKTPTPTP